MIETAHVRLEHAAETLKTRPDVLWTAALENRLRLWALLFESRDYWEVEYPLDSELDPEYTDMGRDFFSFIPLKSWHVAALLRHGKAETDLLSEVDRIHKYLPSDQYERIILTSEQPLYLREEDVERIKSAGELPAAAPETVLPRGGDDAHVSDQLRALNQAARIFWSNADQSDPGTQPTNAKIIAWLEKTHGFSSTLADKAASIIRPKWAHKGRKPES